MYWDMFCTTGRWGWGYAHRKKHIGTPHLHNNHKVYKCIEGNQGHMYLHSIKMYALITTEVLSFKIKDK